VRTFGTKSHFCMKNEWFATWFDSPYYHLLYRKHDETEARLVLQNLLQALQPSPGARILDLACGKGRYARYLAEQGYDVTGLDISPHSIGYARQFETAHLSFFQHDMRRPFRTRYYDATMNMFTSFGYFRQEREHQQVIQHVSNSLRPGGKFLLDYLNTVWVTEHLVGQEIKVVNDIAFHLKRWIEAGRVLKDIQFVANGKSHHFREEVRLFKLADFHRMFAAAGLRIRQTYGDYHLGTYSPQDATRLILLAEKNQ